MKKFKKYNPVFKKYAPEQVKMAVSNAGGYFKVDDVDENLNFEMPKRCIKCPIYSWCDTEGKYNTIKCHADLFKYFMYRR